MEVCKRWIFSVKDDGIRKQKPIPAWEEDVSRRNQLLYISIDQMNGIQ